MANLSVMRCPSCGAALDADSGDTRATCAYCGTSLSIDREGTERDLPDEKPASEAVGAESAPVYRARPAWIRRAVGPRAPRYRPARLGARRAGIRRARRRPQRILFLLLLLVAVGLAVAGCIIFLVLGPAGGAGAGAALAWFAR
jgi:hypothetical protein